MIYNLSHFPYNGYNTGPNQIGWKPLNMMRSINLAMDGLPNKKIYK